MDRNTEYLHRERAALDAARLERATRAPSSPPRSPGAYPNAADDDHHHVVLTHAQIPGLGASSPDDGGLRKYPSWDDNIGDPDATAGPGMAPPPGMAMGAATGMETAPSPGMMARPAALDELAAADAYDAAALREEGERRAMDDELDAAYHAVETASPGMMAMARVAAPEARPRPGAFPGHLPDAAPGTMVGGGGARPRPRKSFAVSGADPVEYEFDPRAAAEAAAAEAKREAFRAELDEQMRVKREMDAARRSGSRPRRVGGAAPSPAAAAAAEDTFYDPGWGCRPRRDGSCGCGRPRDPSRRHARRPTPGRDVRATTTTPPRRDARGAARRVFISAGVSFPTVRSRKGATAPSSILSAGAPGRTRSRRRSSRGDNSSRTSTSRCVRSARRSAFANSARSSRTPRWSDASRR